MNEPGPNRLTGPLEMEAGSLFERAYLEYRPALTAFVRRRVRGDTETADIVQEAYLRLLRYRDSPDLNALKALLFQITIRLLGERSRVARVQQLADHIPFEDSLPAASGAPSHERQSTVEYNTSNYMLGFSYRPISQLMLRASRATAFLPPTIAQLTPPDLSAAPFYNYSALIDRKDGSIIPVGAARLVYGGNPDLVPQHSQSTNVGVVFQPGGKFSGLRLNVEYYAIDQQDAISTLTEQQMLDNEQSFPSHVVRDPVTGSVVELWNTNVNLCKRDAEAPARSPEPLCPRSAIRGQFMHRTIEAARAIN